jgi:uncharacterized protein (TIGR03086 family)
MTTGSSAGNPGRDIVRLDAEAVRATLPVVSLIDDADLARPTPCDGWTVGDLLVHMAVQHDGFAAAAAGNGADLARWKPASPSPGRQGEADPRGEYGAAALRVLAAFAADGVLDREFVLPEISPELRFPAPTAIGFHFVDYVVHGWDVSRSLGLDYELAPDVLAAALEIARLVPDGERRRQPGASFAPRVPATADASPLDQIVALLGRRPGWPEFPPELPLAHGYAPGGRGHCRGRAGRVGRGVGGGRPRAFGGGRGGISAGPPARQFARQRQDFPACLPRPALRAADRSGPATVAAAFR